MPRTMTKAEFRRLNGLARTVRQTGGNVELLRARLGPVATELEVDVALGYNVREAQFFQPDPAVLELQAHIPQRGAFDRPAPTRLARESTARRFRHYNRLMSGYQGLSAYYANRLP